ncbi:HAD-IC family P-type ATPase [Actinomyces sp. B33]|uniref:HAD-IC family P-type ATPase n=1 Tax=Actinomyces sp. B33 TaxID=2942131 RepID=UPI002340629D|nr:HAD-IC family P-type ATPase [Actinomyces sp. B33]MDC4232349.1 HAD-IC family P-type ATPase [Actinomyces sp. B33]
MTLPAAAPPALRTPAPDAAPIGDATRRRADDLKRRLLVCLPLATAVMAVSMAPPLQFTGWQWAAAAASAPVVVWGAWPFHRAAIAAGRHGSTTMDTLVSLGVTASTLWSWWALLAGGAGRLGMTMSMTLLPRAPHAGHHAEIYFEGACMIVVFLLAGRWMEARARYRAGDALRSLLELEPAEATLLVDADGGARAERRIPAWDLRVDDLFLVRPGEQVAADGTVLEGESALDSSLLTGESVPVDVGPGDDVTGATLNTWGVLVVRARRVGSQTTLARIGRMVAEAQAGKAPVQRLADRVSAVFVPVIIAVSAATLIGWLLAGAPAQQAIASAVAVLVVACPCALGLATPTALLVGTGRAARLGIIIKSARVLEQTRAVDTIVLDKTGTVTTGRMTLESVSPAHPAPGTGPLDEDAALRLAAAAESPSEHPVAAAIRSAARARGTSVPPAAAFANHAGLGVSALVPSNAAGDPDAPGRPVDLVLVGRASWITGLGIGLDEECARAVHDAEATGATAVVAALVPDWSDPEPAPPDDAATGAPTPSLPAPGPDALAVVTLDVQGMTCASCVGRVERKLGKLPGVSASVNLATEKATVTLVEPHDDAELVRVVTDAGYCASVVSRQEPSPDAPPAPQTPTAWAPDPSVLSDATTGRALPETLPGRAIGVLVVRDAVKDTSADAVAALVGLGIEPILVTGDNESAARHVARRVGIDRVFAGVMPDGKREVVATLQDEGRVVAVVGDGVNDAAALAQAGAAGLGMAMGSGTDLAIEVADITLTTSDLCGAATAIRISRRTLRTIKQNLFWAFFYNVLMVPLAIAGLLNPMLAAAAMACSSVAVVLNSLRLRTAG